MKVIDLNKNKPSKKKISESEKKAMMDQFSRMLDENSLFNSQEVDLSGVNPELFSRYIKEFPCFDSYKGNITPQALLTAYHEDNPKRCLDEEQELVAEFVFELLSDLDMAFSISEAIEVLEKEDMKALIHILSIHTFLCYEEEEI